MGSYLEVDSWQLDFVLVRSKRSTTRQPPTGEITSSRIQMCSAPLSGPTGADSD